MIGGYILEKSGWLTQKSVLEGNKIGSGEADVEFEEKLQKNEWSRSIVIDKETANKISKRTG